MGQAKIAIVVKDGNVLIRSRIKNISQPEFAMLLINLEVFRKKLVSDYEKKLKTFDGKPENGE